jgi:peptidoglycan/LPS O-acetylase OafA/YrhL
MEPRTGYPRQTGLDLIRIAAALSVFIYHAHDIGFGTLGPLSDHGNLGVPVFFALSGYLVYRPFLWRAVEPVSFILRRALRLAPAWLAAIVGVRLALPGDSPLLALVMWSLFVELTFYAVLPFVAGVARGREMLVVGGLGLASFVAGLAMPGMTVPIVAMPALLPIFFWCFALGMLLAVLERDRPHWILGRLWLAAGFAAVVFGLLVADAYPAGYDDPASSLLVVLGTVAVMGGAIGWRRKWAWAAVGADATYAFYLWHYPILNALAGAMSPVAAAVAGLAIAAAISLATTHVLERPIRRWLDSRQQAGSRRAYATHGLRVMVPFAE